MHSTFSVPSTTTSVQSTTLSAGNMAPSQGSGQTGVIVGSVIGSLLLIAIIVGGAIVFMRHRKNQKGMKNHFSINYHTTYVLITQSLVRSSFSFESSFDIYIGSIEYFIFIFRKVIVFMLL